MFHFAFLIFPLTSLQNLVWKGDIVGFLYQKACFFAPIYAAIFVIGYLCQARRGEAWRAALERISHPIPVLGSARRSLALARLSAALEALVSAGVTIIEAWEIAVFACGSPALARAVLGWRPQLENGRTHAELLSASRDFPEVFVNFYGTGEVSGNARIGRAESARGLFYYRAGHRVPDHLLLDGLFFGNRERAELLMTAPADGLKWN
ncbi:MAG: hypothetical protein DME26_03000 [Verrucomicrobia bacterium]|nr:MAG: hypothetical protein DME26_03000 [Verrucomicrobiota bacterium]